MKVINYQTQPVVLDGGVVLAAAGTDGSVREVESLTDRDRKLEAARQVRQAKRAALSASVPACASASSSGSVRWVVS